MRRDLDCGVHATGRGTTDKQGDLPLSKPGVFFHLHGNHLHLFEAGRDEAREADNVGIFFLGFRQYILPGHHDTHVDDIKVIALEYDGNNIFSDVVNITFHCRNDHFAFAANVGAGGL